MSAHRCVSVFLESTVFWLYLNAVGVALRSVIETPMLPSSRWNPMLKSFVSSLVVDYVWRRFLAVGNCLDPGVPLISIAQGEPRKQMFLHVFVACTFSGFVAFVVSEAMPGYSIQYASWQRERGLLMCFLIEFTFDFIHQVRTATWSTIVTKLTAGNEEEEKSSLKESSPTMSEKGILVVKGRGIHATQSIITASLVAFGSHFCTGGPMLNFSYTVMAALAARDASLLVVLGGANLLAAYAAGLYVQIEVASTEKESFIDAPYSPVSPLNVNLSERRLNLPREVLKKRQ